MIAAYGLLARAQREGICLEAAGDRLRLRAPRRPADDLRKAGERRIEVASKRIAKLLDCFTAQ